MAVCPQPRQTIPVHHETTASPGAAAFSISSSSTHHASACLNISLASHLLSISSPCLVGLFPQIPSYCFFPGYFFFISSTYLQYIVIVFTVERWYTYMTHLNSLFSPFCGYSRYSSPPDSNLNLPQPVSLKGQAYVSI